MTPYIRSPRSSSRWTRRSAAALRSRASSAICASALPRAICTTAAGVRVRPSSVITGVDSTALAMPRQHDANRRNIVVRVVELTGTGLSPADVLAVAREGADVALAPEARTAMEAGAAVVSKLGSRSEPAYGVSTGFGSLANVSIPVERRDELQRALVRSHAAGMGPPVEAEVVRAMLLLRARTLAMGYSGARPAVVEAMLGLLNAGIVPAVPSTAPWGPAATSPRSRTAPSS